MGSDKFSSQGMALLNQYLFPNCTDVGGDPKGISMST